MNRYNAAVLMLALAAALFPGARAADIDEVVWEPDTKVSFLTSHDWCDPGNSRNIVVDREGRVHVAWYNATNYRIVYKRFTPGVGWGDSMMVSADLVGTHYDRYPSVALDNSGRVHVVWASGPASAANASVWYRSWHPIDGWDAASRMLSDDSTAKLKTSPNVAATPNGRVHVAWGERSAVTKYTYYVAYVERIDTTWQPQANLDSSDYERVSVNLAAGANNSLHLVWRGNDPANPTYSQINYKERTGAGWQPSVRVTTGLTHNQMEPTIVVNPVTGQPHVAWRSLVITNGRIVHSYRSGGTWQVADTVSERTWTRVQQEPQIVACRDGRIYVFWQGYSDAWPSQLQIRHAERTPADVWRPALDVTAGAYNKNTPSVATDTLDNPHLVWRDFRASSTNSDIYYTRGFNPARDAGVLRVVYPTGMYILSGARQPQAWVKNYGTADLDSFRVRMTIGTSYTERVTVRNLASGDSALVSFAAWNPAGGVYPVTCSTELAADQHAPNDAKYALATMADFIEYFNSDNARYEATPPSAAWAWGVPASPRPAAYSPPNVWGAPLTGNYAINADWQLVSVTYTATVNTPVVSFWHWYNLEEGYDGGNFSYTTNEGTTWNVVQPWALYSAPYYGQIRGLEYEEGYSGTVTGWQQAFFQIPVPSGTVVRFRWRLGSDASTVSYGWIIDDVALLGLRKPDVGVTGIAFPVGTVVRDSITPSAWVKNYGSVTAGAFDVRMNITPGYTSTVAAGPLGYGESTLVSFARWLPPNPGFYDVKCSTRLAGDHHNPNDFQVGATAFVNFKEGFDASNAGYQPTPPSAAWAWGEPASPPRKPPYSAPNVWGAPLTGNYANNANWQLVSLPYAALSDTPVIGFQHWFRYQPPPAPPTPAYDGGNVSFTTDEGATWTVIEPWAEKAKPYYSEPIAGLQNEYGYTGIDTVWNHAWFKVPVPAGTAFRLRWRLGSNASTYSYGWMIDDVVGMNVALSRDAGVARITSPAGVAVRDSITPSAWVKNYGSAALAAFDVRMSIGAGYVSTVSAGPLGVGESAYVSFAKWLAPSSGFFAVTCSTRLAGDNRPANDAAYGEAVIADFAEYFDTGNGELVADPSSAAWAWGEPAAPPRKPPYSAPNVWGAPLTGNYANNANWKLTSANYAALVDTPVVTFQHWFRYQPPPAPPTPAYDGGNVSISTDNGATWSVIEPWVDRSKPYYSEPIAGLQSEYGYTGIDTFWNQAWFKVPVAAGQTFQLRWRLGSNASTYSYGWMIDDLYGIGMRRPVDVGVTQILAPAGTVNSGTVIAPRARVKNHGGGTRTFDVRFEIEGGYTDTKQVADIAPGEEREVTFTNWTAGPLGTLAVKCSTRLAGDDFPGNDRAQGTVTVRLIDVQTTAITAPVGEVDSGAVVAPKALIKNNGTLSVSFPVLMQIGAYSNTQTVANLAPDEEREVTFANWTASAPGPNVVKCSTRLTGDLVPANDKAETTVVVTLRDVGVTVIVRPSGTVAPGTVVAPACSVYNYGTGNASYPVRLKIGDGYNQTVQVNNHAAGTAQLVTFPNWTANPPGRVAVKCSTEYATDMRPGNDKREAFVSVGTLDAGVATIIAPADSADSGAVVTPRVRVKNFGQDSTGFVVRFAIHQAARVGALAAGTPQTDQVYEDSATVALRGGDSLDVNFRDWTAGPVGGYTLESYTRLAGDVNPDNDTARAPFQVVRAVRDVGATAIVVPIGDLDSGTVVTPSAGVKNFGNRAQTFQVRLTIGSVYTDTKELTLEAGAEDTVTFEDWTAGPLGWHVVACSTMFEGDANPGNDRAVDSVRVVPSGAIGEGEGLPVVFAVSRVVPNPLTGTGVIRLALPAAERVAIRLYDAAGRLAGTLSDGTMKAGYHSLRLGTAHLAEGVYLLRVEAGERTATQKLVVQR